MARWAVTTLPVWCVFPACRHRPFYCFTFYYIACYKIASGNSIFKWAQKDCRFLGRKGIEGESERSVKNVVIDTDTFLKSISLIIPLVWCITTDNMQGISFNAEKIQIFHPHQTNAFSPLLYHPHLLVDISAPHRKREGVDGLSKEWWLHPALLLASTFFFGDPTL
jgi:hypothetical protein